VQVLLPGELSSPENRIFYISSLDPFNDCPAEGVGNVLIKTKEGKQTVISNMLFIHNMNVNILIMRKLLENGFSMKMKDYYMEILDSNTRRILKGTSITKQNFLNPNPCMFWMHNNSVQN